MSEGGKVLLVPRNEEMQANVHQALKKYDMQMPRDGALDLSLGARKLYEVTTDICKILFSNV